MEQIIERKKERNIGKRTNVSNHHGRDTRDPNRTWYSPGSPEAPAGERKHQLFEFASAASADGDD